MQYHRVLSLDQSQGLSVSRKRKGNQWGSNGSGVGYVKVLTNSELMNHRNISNIEQGEGGRGERPHLNDQGVVHGHHRTIPVHKNQRTKPTRVLRRSCYTSHVTVCMCTTVCEVLLKILVGGTVVASCAVRQGSQDKEYSSSHDSVTVLN